MSHEKQSIRFLFKNVRSDTIRFIDSFFVSIDRHLIVLNFNFENKITFINV
jgi:hypothetical protein